MTQQEMRTTLENLRLAFQWFRSIVMETSDLSDAMLADMYPWIFGDKCLLPTIQKLLDRDRVSGMDFYNVMTVVHRFCPEVMCAHATYDFPEPNAGWILSKI